MVQCVTGSYHHHLSARWQINQFLASVSTRDERTQYINIIGGLHHRASIILTRQTTQTAVLEITGKVIEIIKKAYKKYEDFRVSFDVGYAHCILSG